MSLSTHAGIRFERDALPWRRRPARTNGCRSGLIAGRWMFALIAAFCCGAAHGQSASTAEKPATSAEAAKPPADKSSFHLYLLMGQSNMVGRDLAGMDSMTGDPHILAYNAYGQWVVAKDPLHPKVGNIPPGIGPGLSFAQTMLKADPKQTIGLVPCAVGGTPLSRWVKGGDLYEAAVKRAKEAAKDGVIEGMLWHQGESDTDTQEKAGSYEARLSGMFGDLRKDLGLPDLPIVVGQLGEFLGKTPEKYPFLDTVHFAIRHAALVTPHVGFAGTAGLGDKGDSLHFNAAAQREFGVRYAIAMEKLQHPQSDPPPLPLADAAATLYVWPEGKVPGKGADAPEALQTPAKTDAIRITNVSKPTISVFPAKTAAPGPALIVSPGGGYNYTVVDKEGTDIADMLNENGVGAVVLKYRSPNNREGALQDLQRSISLVREHAKEWNIDPNRIGVIGFSAGGHVSAEASTRFGERTYAAIDDTDKISCRPDFAVLVYPAYLAGRDGKLTTDVNMNADIPPTLLVHNDDDRAFAPGTKLYNAALDEKKSPHKFLDYATGGHGYGLQCKGEAKAWPVDAVAWMKETGILK